MLETVKHCQITPPQPCDATSDTYASRIESGLTTINVTNRLPRNSRLHQGGLRKGFDKCLMPDSWFLELKVSLLQFFTFTFFINCRSVNCRLVLLKTKNPKGAFDEIISIPNSLYTYLLSFKYVVFVLLVTTPMLYVSLRP